MQPEPELIGPINIQMEPRPRIEYEGGDLFGGTGYGRTIGEGVAGSSGAVISRAIAGARPGDVVHTVLGSFVVAQDGSAVSLPSVAQNLSSIIRIGGTLGANELALVQSLTSEQRRTAGIFMRPDGTVVSGDQVINNALVNIANGNPLSANQRAALGMLFNATRAEDRGELVNAIAQATGIRPADVESCGRAVYALRESDRDHGR